MVPPNQSVRTDAYSVRWIAAVVAAGAVVGIATMAAAAPTTLPATMPLSAPNRPRAEAMTKLAAARLVRDKDLTAARAEFERARVLDPSYPKPLLHLGGIAFQQEDWPAAIRYYEAFCALDGTSDDFCRGAVKARPRSTECEA